MGRVHATNSSSTSSVAAATLQTVEDIIACHASRHRARAQESDSRLEGEISAMISEVGLPVEQNLKPLDALRRVLLDARQLLKQYEGEVAHLKAQQHHYQQQLLQHNHDHHHQQQQQEE